MSDHQSPNFAAFISYAKTDQTKAEEIVSSLEERGFKCWIAPRDVRPGHSYGDEIIRGIEKSRAFILVLSGASNESSFVAREIERAVSKKKSIFTIRVEAVEPSPSLELFISGTQWIDAFSGRLGPHIEVLATLLPEEGGHEPATVSAARVSLASHKLRWGSPWVLGAAVLLAGFGGALLWNFHRQQAENLPPSPATKSTAEPGAVMPPEASQSKKGNVEPAVITVPNPEVTTKYKPGDTFKDCDGCPEMVVIPSGEFIMGSAPEEKYDRWKFEGPQHSVKIAHTFAVGKFEVTKDQFNIFVNDTSYGGGTKCGTEASAIDKEFVPDPPAQTDHYFRNPGFQQAGNEPAVCISWNDAKAYVAWLSKTTGKEYRLLSEAEWEYVARAGSQLRLVSASREDQLCEYANIRDLTVRNKYRSVTEVANCSDGYVHTAPVGTFAPNSFGVYDMLGNASEWVEDCVHLHYVGAPQDGSAWTSDCTGQNGGHMYRGGSFASGPTSFAPTFDARPAFRSSLEAWHTTSDKGLRVARTLGQ